VATLHKEIRVEAGLPEAWAAVRDVGAVHRRLFPGLVTDCRLEDGERTVTFANGLVLRELIVATDDERHRVAYASVGGRVAHHNASIQVFEDGPGRVRLLWTADFLPDELAPTIGGLMEQGSAVMKRALESGTA
jgi:hypothetical protein